MTTSGTGTPSGPWRTLRGPPSTCTGCLSELVATSCVRSGRPRARVRGGPRLLGARWARAASVVKRTRRPACQAQTASAVACGCSVSPAAQRAGSRRPPSPPADTEPEPTRSHRTPPIPGGVRGRSPRKPPSRLAASGAEPHTTDRPAAQDDRPCGLAVAVVADRRRRRRRGARRHPLDLELRCGPAAPGLAEPPAPGDRGETLPTAHLTDLDELAERALGFQQSFAKTARPFDRAFSGGPSSAGTSGRCSTGSTERGRLAPGRVTRLVERS
ncbi:MAG: hypothetical protein QOJ57_2705 [Thermoleophilaceae bacterium]|nr:hypothetical protein [Thermoleophilaceae bacterium]